MINADAKLKEIFKKAQVSMFEMTKRSTATSADRPVLSASRVCRAFSFTWPVLAAPTFWSGRPNIWCSVAPGLRERRRQVAEPDPGGAHQALVVRPAALVQVSADDSGSELDEQYLPRRGEAAVIFSEAGAVSGTARRPASDTGAATRQRLDRHAADAVWAQTMRARGAVRSIRSRRRPTCFEHREFFPGRASDFAATAPGVAVVEMELADAAVGAPARAAGQLVQHHGVDRLVGEPAV